MSLDVGGLGEALVARWLQTQNWTVLHRRWRCRWGEIDLIAQAQALSRDGAALAFVEVKTRGPTSWDAGGLLAITPRKQAKLWKTAQHFLASYPALETFPCRFDIALVSWRQVPVARPDAFQLPASVVLGQPVSLGAYQLTLQDYIESAFV